MLPDFILSAWWEGEPMEFVARDVPTGVFFYGFQDSFPGAACYAEKNRAEQGGIVRGMEAWADDLLARVIVDPVLTPEMIRGPDGGLGSARDELAIAYLWAVGYDEPAAKQQEILVRPVPAAAPGPPLRPWALMPALATVPAPTLKSALREIAARARTSPHVVWTQWTTSEFIFDWRVLLEENLKKRASTATGNLRDVIGLEAG
jgi:hypothetical protein